MYSGGNVRAGKTREGGRQGCIGQTLSWRDLSVYAMDRDRRTISKQLLNNVRGVVQPGELTAILGGSGAGKSSLMAALAVRAGHGIVVHGDIRVNGMPAEPSFMRRYSGFMHQEDTFIGAITVWEHLWFMARMKLDRRIHQTEVRRRINDLLRDVGLARRRDALIGNTEEEKVLSGGERKRLAFATEVITDPRILFLDEPTTGQDAHSAGVLVSQLKSFASKGRTVLCTIHQPSSAIFDSFQRIIVVADGRIAFAGTTEQALAFFASEGYACPENYNPADFLVATLAIAPADEEGCRRTAQRICDAYLTSDPCKEMDLQLQLLYRMAELDDTLDQANNDPTILCDYIVLHSIEEILYLYLFQQKRALADESNLFKQPYCWVQFYLLIHRGFMQVLRDPSVQLVRILQKVCLATMAGLCFVGSTGLDQKGVQAVQGALFILVTENVFFPMYATLAMIPQELPLFLREYHAGLYSVQLYYLSRIASLVPGIILEPILFTSIVYWLAGLRHTFNAILLTLLVVVFTMNVSTACGCFFSAAFGDVSLAMTYLVPLDCVLLITMGPFAKLSSLPFYIQWVKYVSWLFDSMEALAIVQWKNIYNISCDTAEPDLPCLTDGSKVLDHYDFNDGNFWIDIMFMGIIYIAFHLLGFLSLWKRSRSK